MSLNWQYQRKRPHHDAFSCWLIRLPIFDGCADRWCCSMVGCWGKEWCHVDMWGSLIACPTEVPYDARRWKFISVGGATQELLARIRGNRNSANVECAPLRWDMYWFPRSRWRNSNVGRSLPRDQCERGLAILNLGLAVFRWRFGPSRMAGAWGGPPTMIVCWIN